MKIEEIDKPNKKIKAAIPLTKQKGKIRVKNRDIWYGYGMPVATRQKEFSNKFYIEWQIGYDIITSDNKKYSYLHCQIKYLLAQMEKKTHYMN